MGVAGHLRSPGRAPSGFPRTRGRRGGIQVAVVATDGVWCRRHRVGIGGQAPLVHGLGSDVPGTGHPRGMPVHRPPGADRPSPPQPPPQQAVKGVRVRGGDLRVDDDGQRLLVHRQEHGGETAGPCPHRPIAGEDVHDRESVQRREVPALRLAPGVPEVRRARGGVRPDEVEYQERPALPARRQRHPLRIARGFGPAQTQYGATAQEVPQPRARFGRRRGRRVTGMDHEHGVRMGRQ